LTTGLPVEIFAERSVPAFCLKLETWNLERSLSGTLIAITVLVVEYLIEDSDR
jgi:hypothetical protein